MKIYAPCSCFFINKPRCNEHPCYPVPCTFAWFIFFPFHSDSTYEDGVVLKAGPSMVTVFHQWLPAVERCWLLGTVVTLFLAAEWCWLSSAWDCCHLSLLRNGVGWVVRVAIVICPCCGTLAGGGLWLLLPPILLWNVGWWGCGTVVACPCCGTLAGWWPLFSRGSRSICG